MISQPGHILISRTDSIGDVVLTLPLAKILKEHFPECTISFLGKSYTRTVIESCAHVDRFVDVADFLQQAPDYPLPDVIIHVFPVKAIAERAKALRIPYRIGTTGRLYHWTTCNKLVRLSRKNASLHEAQLNTILLRPLGIDQPFSLEQLGAAFDMNRLQPLDPVWQLLPEPGKFNVILHPRSQGSAREWGLDRFAQLIQLLPPDRFRIFVSGTQQERASLGPLFDQIGGQPHVTDLCGQMDLATFMSFINACDGLVANSTGPLHIAAALGKRAVGIYPPIRPMHPGRWQPLGPDATFLVKEKECDRCSDNPSACLCMKDIMPEAVVAALTHK